MNHLIQLRIVPVSERRISFEWSVRKKPLVPLRANSASFLQIIASGLAHHNRLIREFGQSSRPAFLQCCHDGIKRLEGSRERVQSNRAESHRTRARASTLAARATNRGTESSFAVGKPTNSATFWSDTGNSRVVRSNSVDWCRQSGRRLTLREDAVRALVLWPNTAGCSRSTSPPARATTARI
jgi:hypothetical protein